MSIDQTWQDYCLIEVYRCRVRKPFDNFRPRTNTDYSLTVDGDCPLLDG
jgi:hypothetical protein